LLMLARGTVAGGAQASLVEGFAQRMLMNSDHVEAGAWDWQTLKASVVSGAAGGFVGSEVARRLAPVAARIVAGLADRAASDFGRFSAQTVSLTNVLCFDDGFHNRMRGNSMTRGSANVISSLPKNPYRIFPRNGTQRVACSYSAQNNTAELTQRKT